jgi:hypothetical protein
VETLSPRLVSHFELLGTHAAEMAVAPRFIVEVINVVGVDGCVDRPKPGGPWKIFVDPRSKYYRRARIGDLLGLVMVLHHEQYHRIHGPAEAPAYAATLAFLDRIGARELRLDLVAEVERAAAANATASSTVSR